MQIIGTLVLNGNPTNFFAETEQVAFHTGHLVPGIEGTNDPLLQGRNFSYLDTQLTRLGGPNFTQIPINRPHAPVNDNTRDGFHQQAVHTGLAPYTPNSVDDGVPFPSDWAEGGYVHVPRHVEGDVVPRRPGVVRRPLLAAGAVLREPDQRRAAARHRRVHLRARQVLRAGHQGARPHRARQARRGPVHAGRRSASGCRCPRRSRSTTLAESPALRQIKPTPFPIEGRIVGVVAGPGADLDGIAKLRAALEAEGALLRVIAPHGGQLVKGTTRRDRRADVRHRPLDRVRRDRRRRRRTEGRRLPRADHAAGGVPAPEGRRRLGRRRRGARALPASTRRRRACSPARRRARSWPPPPSRRSAAPGVGPHSAGERVAGAADGLSGARRGRVRIAAAAPSVSAAAAADSARAVEPRTAAGAGGV